MPLTLEVVGQKAAQMGSAARKVFQGGGTIGRLRDNDWVFPDEYISGHHAKIKFANGAFEIEDTSTNGVFINSPQNRMIRGQPYVLRNGDTVFIDDYEVKVSLSTESSARQSPLAEFAAPSSRSPLIPEDDQFDDFAVGSSSKDLDPLSLLGIQDARVVAPGPSAASLASHSPMSEHYRPPPAPAPPVSAAGKPVSSGNNFIPDDYDPFAADDEPAPVKAPPRVAPPPDPPRQVASPFPPAPNSQPARRSPPPPPAPPRVSTPAVSPTVMTNAPQVANGASPVRAELPARDALARPKPGAGALARPRPVAPAAAGVSPPRPVVDFPQSAVAVPAGSSTASTGERRGLVAGAGDVDFARMLAAAGIDGAQITPEVSEQFGKILRTVVAGLMDVLRARDKIKDEFRMRVTTFKQADNNPLKFSANVEDALHNLLVKRNQAYLGPVAAFEDAFQDVRNHQMAMLAGVRVAYEAMLAEFDPQRLQEDFDRHVKSGGLFSASAKQKYWELYRAKFHDMVKDADASFRHLFGDDFAKAYEEQLARLKAANRAERK